MNLGDLHRTSSVHNHTFLVQVEQDPDKTWTKGGGWGFGMMGGQLATKPKQKTIPVGVLEANASLLELVSVLQFGHIFSVDGRLGHGLLEQGETSREKRGGFSDSSWWMNEANS